MKLIYLILTSALVASTSYAMDKAEPKHQAKKQPIPQALVVKNQGATKENKPKLTYIKTFLTPITFNEKTKPLYEWIKNRDHKFDRTNVETIAQDGNTVTYEHDNYKVKNLTTKTLGYIMQGRAFYCSNLEKKYSKKNPDKFIRYGIIVTCEEGTYRNFTGKALQNRMKHDLNIVLANQLKKQLLGHQDANKKKSEKLEIDQ